MSDVRLRRERFAPDRGKQDVVQSECGVSDDAKRVKCAGWISASHQEFTQKRGGMTTGRQLAVTRSQRRPEWDRLPL